MYVSEYKTRTKILAPQVPKRTPQNNHSSDNVYSRSQSSQTNFSNFLLPQNWPCLITRKSRTEDNRTTCFCTRHTNNYEYTALEADVNNHERLQLNIKARERAESACLQYLRFCPRYALIQHLNDLGSRVGKHWFVVRDSSVKTERLLTLSPQIRDSPVTCNQVTRRLIMDLFLALQHPYIYPILDLEFVEANEENQGASVIVVLPFNNKGSLKDLIYKTCWHDEWSEKYGQRSRGLPISQIQRLGRQILEALLFLREREYSYLFHLHSGNVMIQNGVARLSGLENSLLGFSSRIQTMILHSPLLQVDPKSADVVCFGHVLFEMTAGYELTEPEPTHANMLDVAHYPPVIAILDFIFKNPKKRIPSVEELLISEFFRSIDLREMRAASLPVLQVNLTSPSVTLLNSIREHQINLFKKSNNASTSSEDRQTCAKQFRHNNHNLKIQKHKSYDGGTSNEMECINESEDEGDPFIPRPQEHRSLSINQTKMDMDMMELQNLCRI